MRLFRTMLMTAGLLWIAQAASAQCVSAVTRAIDGHHRECIKLTSLVCDGARSVASQVQAPATPPTVNEALWHDYYDVMRRYYGMLDRASSATPTVSACPPTVYSFPTI